jgi:hypothetical protein
LSPIDLYANLKNLFTTEWELPAADAAFFSSKLLRILSTCEARRFREYEPTPWWTFSEAASRSPEYRKYCADGLTRTLVACRANKISTRTAGCTLLQLLFDLAKPGVQFDRVLNAPTNEAWIDPWRAYLKSKGVCYRTQCEVKSIDCANGHIQGVTIEDASSGTPQPGTVTGDYYVAALPHNVMRTLVTPAMVAADPALDKVKNLTDGWMTGIQFYVNRDMSNVLGHTLYIDSEWALTSIAQAAFWQNTDVPSMGNGNAVDILSVDVSEWDRAGKQGKTAKQCTRQEIEDEILEQIKAHLNHGTLVRIDDPDVEDCHLDPAIKFESTTPKIVRDNTEPLLLNTAGSWDDRPEATTKIDNLFLAADYVRTNTDLATMEGANEAARRAVNGILVASGSTQPMCEIWPLKEPAVFATLRAIDKWRFDRGLPPLRSALPIARFLTIPWQVTHTVVRLFNRTRMALRAWLGGAGGRSRPGGP